MDLISREAIMKLTKEMYLEIANTKYDVQTISDCTSYVASKCREYIDEHIRRKDIPSAFEGMTNGEVIQMVFPNASIYKHGSTYSVNNEYNFNSTWWNAPYKAESEESE